MSTPDHGDRVDGTRGTDGDHSGDSTSSADSIGSTDGDRGPDDRTPVDGARHDSSARPETGVETSGEASGGAHAAPRPTPPSGRSGDDVVVDDLRTADRAYDADGAIERGYGSEARTSSSGTRTTGTAPGTGTTPPAGTTAGAAAASAAPRTDEHRPSTPHRDHPQGADRDADRRPVEDRERARVEAEPPSKAGFGRHVLGVVVGLVLTPFAFLLTGIGGARLADIAGTSRMGSDTLGVVVLTSGVVLLAVLVLLGAWSATVPITGGLVWGLALGVAYLVAPGDVEATVENVGGDNIPAAVDQFAQSAMSGLLLLVGVLLLASGLATAVARRAGRRYGAAATEYRHVTSRPGASA